MTATWTPYRIRQLSEQLTERDRQILTSLEQYRLLSTRLIQRLHFPAVPLGDHSSISAATRGTTRVLGRLEQHGLITRLPRRIGGIKHGSSGIVWQLAATGERYLRAQRLDGQRRRFVTPSTTFMEHTLEVAGLAVGLIEKSRLGAIDVLTLKTEPACWREYTSPSGSALSVKPDLAVVTADTEFETHSFVEVDRATEHGPAVLRKCRTYQQYFQSGIEQDRTGVFPLVVWVTPDERRADRLRRSIADDPSLQTALFHVTPKENALSVLAPDATPNPKGGTT